MTTGLKDLAFADYARALELNPNDRWSRAQLVRLDAEQQAAY
jgi:hypothetical protein